MTVKATGSAGVGACLGARRQRAHDRRGRCRRQRRITGDRVTTGSITTLAENLSGSGGSVTLAAQTGLLVGGAVDTSGGNGGNGNPGGNGGPMRISVHGPLTLGGRLRSEGGVGSNGGSRPAATAARSSSSSDRSHRPRACSAVAATAAPASAGPPGRGGDGGRVRVWSQLPSLILLQLVDSTGGTGTPNGTDGPQQEESAPSNLTLSKTGVLAFTPHSPDAEGFRVFQTLARRAGEAPADDEGGERHAAEDPRLRRLRLHGLGLPVGRRLAERPDRPGHAAAAAVGQSGLHRRARRSRSASRS